VKISATHKASRTTVKLSTHSGHRLGWPPQR
jgi:hypothetical protein